MLLLSLTITNILTTDPSNRDDSTAIMKVKQGYEPPTFTGFFGVWDTSLWNVSYARTLVWVLVKYNNITGGQNIQMWVISGT
jgi:hypothetical protein